MVDAVGTQALVHGRYMLIDASGKALMRANGEQNTTNNRMELFGVLAALRPAQTAANRASFPQQIYG